MREAVQLKGACVLALALVNPWVVLCISRSRTVTITQMWLTLCVVLCVCTMYTFRHIDL